MKSFSKGFREAFKAFKYKTKPSLKVISLVVVVPHQYFKSTRLLILHRRCWRKERRRREEEVGDQIYEGWPPVFCRSARIARFLKNGRYVQRTGSAAPMYLVVVFEILVAEVLELVGNVARDNKKNRINLGMFSLL